MSLYLNAVQRIDDYGVSDEPTYGTNPQLLFDSLNLIDPLTPQTQMRVLKRPSLAGHTLMRLPPSVGRSRFRAIRFTDTYQDGQTLLASLLALQSAPSQNPNFVDYGITVWSAGVPYGPSDLLQVEALPKPRRVLTAVGVLAPNPTWRWDYLVTLQPHVSIPV